MVIIAVACTVRFSRIRPPTVVAPCVYSSASWWASLNLSAVWHVDTLIWKPRTLAHRVILWECSAQGFCGVKSIWVFISVFFLPLYLPWRAVFSPIIFVWKNLTFLSVISLWTGKNWSSCEYMMNRWVFGGFVIDRFTCRFRNWFRRITTNWWSSYGIICWCTNQGHCWSFNIQGNTFWNGMY